MQEETLTDLVVDGRAAIAFRGIAALLYFIPWLVAGANRHHQVGAIALTNLLAFVPAATPFIFGGIQLFVTLAVMFSVMWWCIALIWAATLPRHDLRAIREEYESRRNVQRSDTRRTRAGARPVGLREQQQ
jgi:hypothetical protein